MRLCRTGIVGSLMVAAAFAQAQSASVAGSVADRWEIPVPGANLTLTGRVTGPTLTAVAAESGGYVFPQVAPGTYDLSVRVDGFKPYTRHGVEIGDAGLAMDVRMDHEKDTRIVVKELETLAADKPQDYLAHFYLGRAYFIMGVSEKALHEFSESLRLNSDYFPARASMAQLALRAGSPAFALQTAQQMSALKPGNSLGAVTTAEAYQRLGQPDAAADLLEKFCKSNPNDTDVLLQLGSVNLQRKQYPEAEKAYSRAYSLDPSNVVGLQGLAEIQLLKKEPEKAVQLVTAELEKYPQNIDLRKALAATEFEAQQVDKAIADYQSIVQKYQDTPKEQAVIYARLGSAYRTKEDLPRAIENFKKATQLAPENSVYLSGLANVYDRAGKLQEALSCYKQALKVDPGNAFVMNNAAYVIVKAGGDLAEALRLVQMARRQYPDSTEILDTLGSIYLKMNMVDSASQIFQGLIEKTNSNPLFHYHYAIALAQKGDKAAALKELDLALKNNPNKAQEEEIKELMKKLG